MAAHLAPAGGRETIDVMQPDRTTSPEAPAIGSEDCFHTLADNIAQLAWMAGGNGGVFWFNKRWFDFTGTRLEDVRGWGWRRVVHPDHIERVLARVRECLDRGDVWEDTFPLRSRDGTYRWFLSRAVPVCKGGRVVRWFGTGTDVTEQRAAEEILRDADRRKDEFLAMLAHELRNPLAPVLNAVCLLKLKAPADPDLRSAHDAIERQVGHMARLVEDLLDLSRIGCGKLVLRKEVIELSGIVGRAIETTASLMQQRRHRLAVSLPPEPQRINADPDRLEQIFVNLLTNAAKYTEPGGHIALTAEPAEGELVEIRVRDSGIGMSAGFLTHAFQLFRQAEDVDSAHARGGLGVGLSLVRHLVEMHGGSVAAQSAGRGQGSEFTVRLPLVCGAGSEPFPAPCAVDRPVSVPARRILVVDDNVDAAFTLGRLLELDAHAVRIVHDGPRALAAFDEQMPDVVLLDIGLPGIDGHAVAREMRCRPGVAAVQLVALTGFAQEEDRRRSLDAGFDHHLVKPVHYETLRSLLARAACPPCDVPSPA